MTLMFVISALMLLVSTRLLVKPVVLKQTRFR